MPVKESTQQQYDLIRQEFEKLNTTEFGVQKYTHKWMFAKLAKKYFKKPNTIEQIVFHRL